MTDIFESSKYSIYRAKHHVEDLKRCILEFNGKKPYTTFVETDLQTSQEIHKIRFTENPPEVLPGIIADAVNNLRSALDQAMYAVALVAGIGVKYYHFAFANSPSEWERVAKGRCKDLPAEIIDWMRKLKPYKGGDDYIWTLNEVCNANKHKTISLVMTRPGRRRIEGTMAAGSSIPSSSALYDPLKKEIEIFRQPIGAATDAHFNIAFFIAIGDIEGIENVPVDTVLGKFLDVVYGVVVTLEAESRRIGLI